MTSAKFFSPRPLEVYEIKKDDKSTREHLEKHGFKFNDNDDGSETIEGKDGGTSRVSEGDYLSLLPDGTARVLNKQYFEQNFVEHGKTPDPLSHPPGAGKPKDPEDAAGKPKDLRPDEKPLNQKDLKPGELPDQKAAQSAKR
jgi:hypothetical protein